MQQLGDGKVARLTQTCLVFVLPPEKHSLTPCVTENHPQWPATTKSGINILTFQLLGDVHKCIK